MVLSSKLYANAVISNKEKDLQNIHDKAKNIAVYERQTDQLRSELDQLRGLDIEHRASGAPDEIMQALRSYFDNSGISCPALLDDISSIVKLFEQITKVTGFRLLLATIQTDMCRKFHTDINTLRLLCTYIGPGTIWLPDEAVDQKALVSTKKDQNIVKNDNSTQQVGTGDVVILKGALYPDANPIMHRSPAVKASNEKRLLLRIDTNEGLSF